MINETVKSLKKDAVLSPVCPRPLTPPLQLTNKLIQQCREEESLYKCSSRDSLASLNSLQHQDSIASPKKYILEDNSAYNDVSNDTRVDATTRTNFLKPRMKFTGYQVSGYKKYQVIVDLQTVDLPTTPATTTTPHLTGFLTIRGLTNQHPEITTFFESFTVMDTIGFLSSCIPEELNAYKGNDHVDLEHWLNFPCFKELCMRRPASNDKHSSSTPYACNGKPNAYHKYTNYANVQSNCVGGDADVNILHQILNGQYTHENYLCNRFIFMRWKEKFLVPDAEIDSVEGASYDGYYYIVHDQVTGNILGFYYHKDAEKFQQLELSPVMSGMESACDFEFC